MEQWDLYDQTGMLLNKTHQRGTPMLPETYHMVVSVWIQNDKGEYLIQQRNKPVSDGRNNLWTCAAAGAAQKGESSNKAIIRELHEELGILSSTDSIRFQDRVFYDDFFMDTWLLTWNGMISDINLDPVEVSNVKWVSIEQLHQMVVDKEFFDEGSDYFNLLTQKPHHSHIQYKEPSTAKNRSE